MWRFLDRTTCTISLSKSGLNTTAGRMLNGQNISQGWKIHQVQFCWPCIPCGHAVDLFRNFRRDGAMMYMLTAMLGLAAKLCVVFVLSFLDCAELFCAPRVTGLNSLNYPNPEEKLQITSVFSRRLTVWSPGLHASFIQAKNLNKATFTYQELTVPTIQCSRL